jgi:hypothetical protein
MGPIAGRDNFHNSQPKNVSTLSTETNGAAGSSRKGLCLVGKSVLATRRRATDRQICAIRVCSGRHTETEISRSVSTGSAHSQLFDVYIENMESCPL